MKSAPQPFICDMTDSRENTDQCKQDSKSRFVGNNLTARESTDDYDKASLQMPNNGTFERS